MTPVSPLVFGQTSQTLTSSDSAMREAATQLEANFLAEMLKSAGLGETSESFGGGVGEDQFSSFLVRAQAEHIAQSGGVGLAETFFNALKERTFDT